MARTPGKAKASVSNVYRLPSTRVNTKDIGNTETHILRMARLITRPPFLLCRVFAGRAFTTTSFPNIVFFPASAAFVWRVLIPQCPGIIKLPAFFMRRNDTPRMP